MTKHIEAMKLLQRHFDIALETPDGIKKLRELILTLAVQGKLVPQDPKDQPASELLKEIEAEKKRLVKEGKIKQNTRSRDDAKEIKASEVPYELPKDWEWVRLREICHDWGQKTPDKKFAYIDVGSIDNSKGVVSSDVQLLESVEAPSRARKIVRNGTVIYSTVRPYLLNVAIVDKEFESETIASTAFAVVHPFSGINNKFIYQYLRSPEFIKYVERKMKGVAYPAINDGDFFQGVFPLPPLAEQRRIVAKIDQLMALCDKLEAERNERNQKRLTVHTAAMNRLLTAPDKTDFDKSWHFITRHFGELYSVPQNVMELKKAILQLAVMGKLVPQDPKDQPASELLKEIEAEKMRLVKEGKIKKSEPLPPIKPEEIPYDVPKGWEWVKLQDALDVRDGTHDSPKYVDSGIPLVTSKDFINGKIDFSNAKRISVDDHNKIKMRSHVENEDILFSMIGGNIGNMVMVNAYKEFSIKNVALFKYYDKAKIVPNYLMVYLKGMASEIQSKASGGAQPFVSLTFLRNHIFPLPPLAEQKRIVAKIDQLMALCDTLDKQISSATKKQTAILNAVLAKV